MGYADKTLKCTTCSADFVFTAGEQEFFASKGFANEPKHCVRCRASRRGRDKQNPTGDRRPRRQESR